jgi:hypothetical protein
MEEDHEFPIDFENEILELIENENENEDISHPPLNDYFRVANIVRFEKNSDFQIIIHKLYGEHTEICEVFIKGKWAENNIELNDSIYLNCHYFNLNLNMYELNEEDNCYLKRNFIVVEPEIMLGSTLIKYGFPCKRRAVISEIFKIVNKQNKMTIELLVGIVVHEIFEFVVLKGVTDFNKIFTFVEDVLRKHYLEICLINLSLEECRSMINEFVVLIVKFFSQFVLSKIELM